MNHRFKDKGFNKIYKWWVSRTKEEVELIKSRPAGSNRDTAFKRGLLNYRCVYQRNWPLYPIYVAGKEWEKVNKIGLSK